MVLKEFSLDGKVAIVTGASRGIGKAIATTMAEAGADIVAAARTESALEQTAKEVRKFGRKCLVVTADMTKMEQVENMVNKTIAEFGKIDVLVNNVGYDSEAPLVVTGEERSGLLPGIKLNYKDMTEETWRTVIEANLGATFRCCKAVGPHMVKQKSGKIINIGSFCALLYGPADTHYGAAKYAINRLTKVLALEWAPYKINVNCIGPGSYVTQIRYDSRPHMTREQVNQVLEKIPNAVIPLGYHGDTRVLGLLAVYLASPASDYMTGQVIYLDGGITAQ